MSVLKAYVEPLKRYALKFRRERFKLFEDLVADFGDKKLKILDVGGYQQFWEQMGFDLTKHEITVLNVPEQVVPSTHPNVKSLGGDGTNMPEFSRGDFDVVFSNSVLEHVGLFSKQREMAREIRRLSDVYFVQTPNFYFPMEPHFHVPAFQMLPLGVRQRLIQSFALGCMPRIEDADEARKLAEETRLLTKREMRTLFPEARIVDEKVLGLTKSIIALRRRAG